jgi:hypothetical protein
MVFDDGMYASEKTLVEIGDYGNLNESAVLQSHSLEDGIYKSGIIRIGDRCTIENNAFLHYGCSVGDDAVIAPDSFVMKGENVEANTVWWGNPAIRKVDLPHLIDTRSRVMALISRLQGISVSGRALDLVQRLEDVAIRSRMAELAYRLETLAPGAVKEESEDSDNDLPR